MFNLKTLKYWFFVVVCAFSIGSIAKNLEVSVVVPDEAKREFRSRNDIKEQQVNNSVIRPLDEEIQTAEQADSAEEAPEIALRKAWKEEQAAIRAKQQAEYDNIAARDHFQLKKEEIKRQISRKMKKIYSLKQKEQEYYEDVDRMRFELTEMEERGKVIQQDLLNTKEREKKNYLKFSKIKDELDQSQAKLSKAYNSMIKAKSEADKKISKYKVDMQIYRSQIASTQADIARIENDKVRAKTEELQVRTQWAAMATQLLTLKDEKDQAMTALSDINLKLDNAKQAYKSTKDEISITANVWCIQNIFPFLALNKPTSVNFNKSKLL